MVTDDGTEIDGTEIDGTEIDGTEIDGTEIDHPVTEFRTSRGSGGHERVDSLTAIIYQKHLKPKEDMRRTFPRTVAFEDRFGAIKAEGDERGHLVASQFSGPQDSHESTREPRRWKETLE